MILVEVMLLGSGLNRLSRVGSANREIDYYSQLASRMMVDVLAYDELPGAYKFRQISVGSVKISRWVASLLLPIKYYLTCNNPTIVRSKQFLGCWTALITARVTGAISVARLGYVYSQSLQHKRKRMSPNVLRFIQWLERSLLNKFDYIQYGAEHIQKCYEKGGVIRPSVVITNGVNGAKFDCVNNVEKVFSHVWVGRLTYIKGADKIELAMEKIGINKLLIIGEGDVSVFSCCAKRVHRLLSVPNDTLPQHLLSARKFLSLSRSEGSPKALIEAIFCGLYPVVSDIPAHREVLLDLGYGDLLDKELEARSVGQPSLEKLESFKAMYSMDRIVNEELKFLESIVGK